MADPRHPRDSRNEPDTPQRALWDAAQHAPVAPQAREALLSALDEGWADPRRLHREGRTARLLLDGARESIAAGLGVRPQELALTGSFELATQAAVLGVAAGRARTGRRLVHSAVEHSAVLKSVQWRADTHPGTEISELGVDRLARIDPDELRQALSGGAQPGLVALQLANAEVGTIQPIEEAGELCRGRQVPLVCDLSASVGAIELPPAGVVDVGFADPTCWAAPPGVGVLTIRTGVRWRSPWPGSADEAAHTPGSPGGAAVPQALAAAVALQVALGHRAEADRRRRRATRRLRAELPRVVDDIEVVGDPDRRLPHVLTFSVLYADGEALVEGLDAAGFAVGSGSACTASTLQPSHVLAAMGVLTHGNVRIALPYRPREDLDAQVESFLDVLPTVVAGVRSRLGVSGL